jgi:vitamin B12 transporter
MRGIIKVPRIRLGTPLLSLTIIGAWGSLAPAALAQAPASSAQALSADAQPGSLDQAQSSQSLAEVIVTATKLNVAQQDMTQASEVVAAPEIAAQAQTSVTDVLREQPGIQFEVSGTPGQFIYPRLRGFSDSTLYVFDGITMNTGGTGDIGYLLGQLDPTMVQSIEVLRGPRATTYGANSTSGVIAFTTLDADHEEADVSVEGGSLDWVKGRVGIGDKVSLGEGSWSFSLNGSYLHTDGMNEYEYTENGTLVGRTTYRTSDLELGGSFYVTDNAFQTANLIESVQDAPPPYFSVQLPDPSNLDTTKAGIVSLWFAEQLTPHLSQKLTVGWAGQNFLVEDGPLPNGGLLGTYNAPYDGWTDPDTGITFSRGQVVPVYQTPFTYKTVNNNKEADYNLRYRSDTVSAILGVTYLGQVYDETEDYAGFYSGGHDSEAIRSIYGDAAIGWLDNQLHTEFGARLDSYTEWRNKVTYSVGATYDIVPELAIYANYGTSFTQPTLDELNDPIYGNKSITPENADTVEVGLRGRQLDGALTESLTSWHSYVDNVITFDYDLYNPRIVDAPPYGEYANEEAERSQGIEFEIAYHITPHLIFDGNYTRTDAYLNTAGVWGFMVENARNMGNAGLTYTTAKFDFGTNLFVTDHRLRWAADFWAPGYARLDFFGRYHVTGHFDLYGRVQNALDQQIVQILGYRNPGVYFVAGVSYRFD